MRHALLLLLLLPQTVLAAPEVTTFKGKPSSEIPACPGKEPCVVYFDGGYIIHAKSWNRYYVVDSDPVAAIPAKLDELHVKHAKLSCGIYLRARALTGAGPTLSVPVPKRAAGTVIEKRPVTELVTEWEAMRREVPHPLKERGSLLSPLFEEQELGALTKDSFEHPTLRAFWVTSSSGKILTERNGYLLFSPESAHGYLIAEKVERPINKGDPAHVQRIYDSLASTLASIGATTLEIDARDACSFRDLLPNKGWVDYRR